MKISICAVGYPLKKHNDLLAKRMYDGTESNVSLSGLSDTDRVMFQVLSNHDRIDMAKLSINTVDVNHHSDRFEELPTIQEQNIQSVPPLMYTTIDDVHVNDEGVTFRHVGIIDPRGEEETTRGGAIREETTREEPIREERMGEEPIREETTREERMGGETTREERMGGEPIREETTREEPMREERMGGETTRGEPIREETTREERMGGETTREERMGGETTREERMRGETTREERMGGGVDRDMQQKDNEDDILTKRSLILDLQQLRSSTGITLTKEWTMEDKLEDMLLEMRRHTLAQDEKQNVTMMRDGMRLLITGIEMVNNKMGFLDLDGWSAEVCKDLHKHDTNLAKIYRKYWRRGTNRSPEMSIAMSLVGGMGMHHIRRSMAKGMMQRAQTYNTTKGGKNRKEQTQYIDDDSSDEEEPPLKQ